MLILHLSDIHFKKAEVGTAQDPNFHLRNELVRDVAEQCKALGTPDVIIISGDIAYAGDPEEFKFATTWLSELCAACGAKMSCVFVCPGNHDVVRERAGQNLVQLIHGAIKTAADPKSEISRQLRDKNAAGLLYEGLQNYNAFALQFFCDLLPPDRTRAVRDLSLNDGSTLRLWGLNSVVVSSEHDRVGSLYVDEASHQITRHAGVVNLVVAHHHLTWLGNAQELEDHLNDVAPIQMFGHVHNNRIKRDMDGYMRLTASAANPDRTELGWEPGYNFLEVSVQGTGVHRKLLLRAHVRVWQNAPGRFKPKMTQDAAVWDHTVNLEKWSPSPPVEASAVVVTGGASISVPASDVGELPKERGAMNRLRDIGLRFYKLSFSQKWEIAGRLGLVEETDVSQPDYERFRRVFQRASERGQIQLLEDAIRAAENS